jgi:hypothetical protein
LEGLDKTIDDLEDEIASAEAQNEMVRLLDKVPGIGKLIASVIAASVPDPSAFKSGRDFAAWLGLTPRQNSSGGKQTLGGIGALPTRGFLLWRHSDAGPRPERRQASGNGRHPKPFTGAAIAFPNRSSFGSSSVIILS